MSGTVTSAEDTKENPVVTPPSEVDTPTSTPEVTPPSDGSQTKDDSSLVDDLVYAKNYIIQNMTAPKLIGGAITAAALGSELGKKKSLPIALVTAGGTALGGYLGKNL